MEDSTLKNYIDDLDLLLQDNEALEALAPVLDMLQLPEEEFEMLAPGVLEAFQQSVNNPNDKLSLAQALNASGMQTEDLTENLTDFLDEMDTLPLSAQKRDFLKSLAMTIVNAVNETEGVAKKYITFPIELCHPDAKVPQYAHTTDSGMDVYAVEDVTIAPGETVLVPTGIKVALPPGYELQVRPKSGRALKTKLRVANTPGTIDAGYRDEIKVIIENVDPPIRKLTYEPIAKDGALHHLEITSIEYGREYTIEKGEKFCQLVLMEVPKATMYTVESVADIGEDRDGGFGSTGLKEAKDDSVS